MAMEFPDPPDGLGLKYHDPTLLFLLRKRYHFYTRVHEIDK